MSTPTVTAKGPRIGSFRGKDVPEWIETETGERLFYQGTSEEYENAEGGVELALLPESCSVISPGLVYGPHEEDTRWDDGSEEP